jgi:polyhydroxybutyrate depolymerase
VAKAGVSSGTRRFSVLCAAASLVLSTIVVLLLPNSEASATTVAKSVSRSSPGCTKGIPPSGAQPFSFTANGVAGSYLVQLPSDAAPDKSLPLLFDFHGYGESGSTEASFSGLSSFGRSHGFVTVTPWVDNQPVPLWLSNVGSPETNWIGALLNHVELTTCVDENRIFVTGYSNGGYMALAVACQFSQQVAAVATVAGLAVGPHCKPTHHVSLIAFQGTADPLLHYNGTPSQEAENLPAPNGSGETEGQYAKQLGANNPFKKGPTIPQQAALWAKRNGCSAGMKTTRVANKVALLSWSCPYGVNVNLYRIQGGGHAWPGSTASAALHSAIGETTFEISANAEIWRFFQGHPLRSS